MRRQLPVDAENSKLLAYRSYARVRKERWAPPTGDCVKINVDASFDPDILRGTTGAVIRDKKGKFIAACNARLDMVQDVLSAEALALKHGLFLAESMGCNRVVVSSDNSELIEIMRNERPPTGIAAAIYHDCFSMESDFVRVKYEHANRETNSVAHELAQLVKFQTSRVWMDDPPPSIVPLMVNDVTLLSIE